MLVVAVFSFMPEYVLLFFWKEVVDGRYLSCFRMPSVYSLSKFSSLFFC